MEIKGKVFKVLAEQKGVSAGGKEWVKIDVVIEEIEGQYPKKIAVTAMGEKIVPVVKGLAIGQIVTAHINLESREYQERWFTNVNVWRIDKEGITPPVVAETVSVDLPF
jgi:hypothetical protein